MKLGKRPVVGAVLVVAIVAIVAAIAWRPHDTGVPAARRIVADTSRFQTNTGAAQAMYDASRELLRAAQRCRADHQPDARCRPLYESAAIGQAVTATLVHCRGPEIFAVHTAWTSYLRRLDHYRTTGGPPPELPALATC